MEPLQALGLVAIVLGVPGTVLAAAIVRSGRISGRWVVVLALFLIAALILLLAWDWPLSEVFEDDFLSDHGTLAGVVSSLLVVAVAFLGYQWHDQERQDELAQSLSGTGAGGMVDHLVDAEVALALASANVAPEAWSADWKPWREPGKPLKWLRQARLSNLVGDSQPEVLQGAPAPGRKADPRLLPPTYPTDVDRARELVDLALRRVLAGMRDWSPLLAQSTEGKDALIALSDVRVSLMELDLALRHKEEQRSVELLGDVRLRLRVVALLFERWSGAPELRAEVLTHARALPNATTLGGVRCRGLRERFTGVSRDLDIELACQESFWEDPVGAWKSFWAGRRAS